MPLESATIRNTTRKKQIWASLYGSAMHVFPHLYLPHLQKARRMITEKEGKEER
jgi:hypothetical protein